MYDYLRMLLNAAETIGSIGAVRMEPNWIPGRDRIYIEGTADNGDAFTLELEFTRKENQNADRN